MTQIVTTVPSHLKSVGEVWILGHSLLCAIAMGWDRASVSSLLCCVQHVEENVQHGKSLYHGLQLSETPVFKDLLLHSRHSAGSIALPIAGFSI